MINLFNHDVIFPQDEDEKPITLPTAKPLTIDTVVDNQEDDDRDVDDGRYVFFFDIDNCLYPKSTKIHELMKEYIHKYFVSHLSLDDEEAQMLHSQYYRDYGLALEGLVRFHHIDALEYNKEVDDALPLDKILRPDNALRVMLSSIDRTKVRKLWLFTNAYKSHGERVVKLLGIDDLFDGMTFCDYGEIPLVCKPKFEMFDKAMREAGVTRKDRCLYVDDSYLNVQAAMKYGWTAGSVLYVESEEELPKPLVGTHVIRSILDLPLIFPEIFSEDGMADFAHLICQPTYNLTIEELMKLAHMGEPKETKTINGVKKVIKAKGEKSSSSDEELGTVTPATHEEKRSQWSRRLSKQLLDTELKKLKALESKN